MNVEERLDLLEFQLELLFNNTSLSSFIYEYNITRDQYKDIKDIMDSYRNKIYRNEPVNSAEFEQEIYSVIDDRLNGNYRFCETIAKLFMENGQWKEVFPELYGDFLKY